MRTSIFFILLLLSIKSAHSELQAPLIRSKTYKHGEYLSYTVSFGFYTGATATLSVSDTLYNGRECNLIRAHAQTIGIADYLYKIRDRYESIVDRETNLPHFSKRDINEGRYHHYNEVTYNREMSQATSLKTGVHNLTHDVQDILSTFYFARNNNFNDRLVTNQLLTFYPFFCDKKFELILRYRGLEVVETRYGEIECYRFSLCERKGNTISTLDQMSFWISHDENRVPIKVKFKLVVGAFEVKLNEFTGISHPFIFNKSK